MRNSTIIVIIINVFAQIILSHAIISLISASII